MEGPSVDWCNLSSKSKFMMSYIRKLGKKLDKIGKDLDLVQKDTQSVNAKVKVLSRQRDERPKVVSLHESGRSFEEGNYSERGRSLWPSMEERRERIDRVEDIGGRKEWKYMELKVEQILSYFDLYDRMVVRLVILEFSDYALGSRSVEVYHKEMEMDLMRTQIREIEKATMAQFLHELNTEIQDVLKLGSDSSLGQKETTTGATPMAPRTSNIKCFKCLSKGHIASRCPNRRVMIMKDDKEIESDNLLGEVGFSNEVESLSDSSHYEGNLLVMRKLGSCVNVASERLVKKLALPISMHPRPGTNRIFLTHQQ
ncbi:hypothetical protein CR513_18713, partial [Mucuna pruriens]